MMNAVNLIGRLTAAPTLQKTGNDKSYTRLTLAVNRRFKTADGRQEADFITVVFWGRFAETLTSYAKKGLLLSVEGEIRAYSYEDKKKERRYVTEVLGTQFSFLESRATVALRENGATADDQGLKLDVEDLPF